MFIDLDILLHEGGGFEGCEATSKLCYRCSCADLCSKSSAKFPLSSTAEGPTCQTYSHHDYYGLLHYRPEPVQCCIEKLMKLPLMGIETNLFSACRQIAYRTEMSVELSVICLK